MRTLNRIAAEIVTIWRDHPPSPAVKRYAGPYILAMLDLLSCKDSYGLESGDMVVARAVDNLANWRGADARRIKAELKDHLERFNVSDTRNQR